MCRLSAIQAGQLTAQADVLTLIDSDTLALSSKDRKLNGKVMPDLKGVRLGGAPCPTNRRPFRGAI